MARISTLPMNEFLKSFSISLNSSVIGDNRTRWYGVVDGMWDQWLGLSVPLVFLSSIGDNRIRWYDLVDGMWDQWLGLSVPLVFPSSIGDNRIRWYDLVDGMWDQWLGLSVPLVFPSSIGDNRIRWYDLVDGISDQLLGLSVPLVFPSCWLWAGNAFWDLVEKGTSSCIITFISVPMVHDLIITLYNNGVQG